MSRKSPMRAALLAGGITFVTFIFMQMTIPIRWR